MVAARPLAFDPVLDAMKRAPEEHEPLTPEQEAECERAKGEPTVSTADMLRAIGELRLAQEERGHDP
jgi:hypothetical protein